MWTFLLDPDPKSSAGSGSGSSSGDVYRPSYCFQKDVLKGTVSPVLRRLKVVLLNIVESGEVPLVIKIFFVSSNQLIV